MLRTRTAWCAPLATRLVVVVEPRRRRSFTPMRCVDDIIIIAQRRSDSRWSAPNDRPARKTLIVDDPFCLSRKALQPHPSEKTKLTDEEWINVHEMWGYCDHRYFCHSQGKVALGSKHMDDSITRSLSIGRGAWPHFRASGPCPRLSCKKRIMRANHHVYQAIQVDRKVLRLLLGRGQTAMLPLGPRRIQTRSLSTAS